MESVLDSQLPADPAWTFVRSGSFFYPIHGLFFIADILGGNKIVLVGSVIQEQITKGRNQPFAAALSAVLMVLTSVMIRLYRKITGTSQLEGML